MMINLRDELSHVKTRLDIWRAVTEEYERHYQVLSELALRLDGGEQVTPPAPLTPRPSAPAETPQTNSHSTENADFLLEFVNKHADRGVSQVEIKAAFAAAGRETSRNYVSNTVNRLAKGPNRCLRIEGSRKNGRVFPVMRAQEPIRFEGGATQQDYEEQADSLPLA
jgi:hypothetical protein